ALAGAGADLAGPLPRRGGDGVALPEGPGAALARPHRVDRTAPLPVEEDAVAVHPLAEAAAPADGARVDRGHLFDRLAEVFGDRGHLLVAHPHVARRPGAAVAAAGAAEAEAVLVPRFAHRTALRRVTVDDRSRRGGSCQPFHWRRPDSSHTMRGRVGKITP